VERSGRDRNGEHLGSVHSPPVATTLVMLGILMFGLMAYRLLPVSDLPNVDFPTITVSAGLPGASPQTMAAAVRHAVEKQFSTIAGLDAMTSSSTLAATNITLQFTLSRDIDPPPRDVQARSRRPAANCRRGFSRRPITSPIQRTRPIL